MSTDCRLRSKIGHWICTSSKPGHPAQEGESEHAIRNASVIECRSRDCRHARILTFSRPIKTKNKNLFKFMRAKKRNKHAQRKQLNERSKCSRESAVDLIRLDLWLTSCFSDVAVDLFARSSNMLRRLTLTLFGKCINLKTSSFE